MGRQPTVSRKLSNALAALALFGSLVVVGCHSTEAQLTQEERDNFKGGPMPKGFLDQHGGTPAPGTDQGK